MPGGAPGRNSIQALTGNRSLALSIGQTPTRVRRFWANKLVGGMEAVEKVVEDMETVILQAHDKGGLSFTAIGGMIGLNQTTVKDIYDRADKRRAESGSAGTE